MDENKERWNRIIYQKFITDLSNTILMEVLLSLVPGIAILMIL